MKNIHRPFSLVISKYNDEGKIEAFDGSYSTDADINFLNTFEKWDYLIWIYCFSINESLINDFEYTFRITSEKSSLTSFISEDKNYNFLSNIIVNYKKTNQKIKQTNFISVTELGLKKAGLQAIVGINYSKTDQYVNYTVNESHTLKFLSWEN